MGLLRLMFGGALFAGLGAAGRWILWFLVWMFTRPGGWAALALGALVFAKLFPLSAPAP